MDDRLIEIETRVAFQDDLITALNGVVAELQHRCARLEALCEHLSERVESLSEAGAKGAAEADEPPPHF